MREWSGRSYWHGQGALYAALATPQGNSDLSEGFPLLPQIVNRHHVNFETSFAPSPCAALFPDACNASLDALPNDCALQFRHGCTDCETMRPSGLVVSRLSCSEQKSMPSSRNSSRADNKCVVERANRSKRQAPNFRCQEAVPRPVLSVQEEAPDLLARNPDTRLIACGCSYSSRSLFRHFQEDRLADSNRRQTA